MVEKSYTHRVAFFNPADSDQERTQTLAQIRSITQPRSRQIEFSVSVNTACQPL
jgi:hypothetical protein